MCCRFEAHLVEQMVKDIVAALGMEPMFVAKYSVGHEQRLQPILAALNRRQIVGVHGMGGVGKSTLARALYNRLCLRLERGCAFVRVGRDAGEDKLPALQSALLRDFIRRDRPVHSVAAGQARLDRLGSADGLLVLDDVWTRKQLDALLVTLGPGMRVVITTRKEELLNLPGAETVRVQPLDVKQSLELLSWHAFAQPVPESQYEGVVAVASVRCGGLPLCLEVVGAHMYGKSVNDWEDYLRMDEPFQDMGQGYLSKQLRHSYDDLPPRLQRIFLDIACMMSGWRVRTAEHVWGSGTQLHLKTLQSLSLLEEHATGDGRLALLVEAQQKDAQWLSMHDQLRDMGRQIEAEAQIRRNIHDPDEGRDCLNAASQVMHRLLPRPMAVGSGAPLARESLFLA